MSVNDPIEIPIVAPPVKPKVRRRKQGSGTIRERRPGVWEIRAFAGKDLLTGKPRQISRTFRGGRRGAETALAKLRAEVSQGAYGTSRTLRHLSAQWLAVLPSRGVMEGTIDQYRKNMEKHVLPTLGDVKLTNLTALDLERLYAYKRDVQGLAPNTVVQIHATVSAALNQAATWGWINEAQVVTHRAKPPKRKRWTRPVPTAEQVGVMMALALQEGADYATLLILAAKMGARRGELCGLRWSDLDPKDKTIKVSRALVPGKGGVKINPLKTDEPRVVPLEDDTLAILAQYMEIQKDRRAAADDKWDPNGWLLSYDGGGSFFPPWRASNFISGIAKAAGTVPGVVLHSLRHFTATELMAAGMDVVSVAAMLGHDPAMTLDVYAHVVPEQVRRAAALMAGILKLDAVSLPAPLALPPAPDEDTPPT